MTAFSLTDLIHAAMTSGNPLVMGVVNVTPDSFSDGGLHASAKVAVQHALSMDAAGAQILDIGGESTRPGAAPVSLEEELNRVLPVIEGIRAQSDCAISIDTSKPEVMTAALKMGANMVNDVNALRAEGAMEVVLAHQVPVALMHMQGEPRTMQDSPHYQAVLAEVSAFLIERAQACLAAGLDPKSIVLDPGFGFGKALSHNIELLGQLPMLVGLGYPVLVGLSRKSMLGTITGRSSPKERVTASVAAGLLAAQAGAAIIRVHDVQETIDALKVWQAVKDQTRRYPVSEGG